MAEAPDIILITSDQQRGDCLGIEGHPALQTPNLDHLGASGTRFRRAYAESPSCIPARRSLMTGTAPAAHGMVGFRDGVAWNPAHTLAGTLARAGYETVMIGKLHLWPRRRPFGFERMLLADWTGDDGHNDYVRWLRREHGVIGVDPAMAHGVSPNSWVSRPHHLPETQMHTFWCIEEAMRFLQQREGRRPLFLNISFIDPHPPLTPPAFYYDRYINRELPSPVIGDWAPRFDGPRKGLNPEAFEISLDHHDMRCARAGYYGMINFIDDQVGRLVRFARRQLTEAFMVYTSDHGEMLGDHNLFRKGYAYEASARVPMLMRAPIGWGLAPRVIDDQPVGLQDVMPTLLDAAGVDVPDTCTGRSLLPIMRGGSERVRPVLHGEHAGARSNAGSVQFITDGRHKYIWFAQDGREQLFDLEKDPDEQRDLAPSTDASQLEPWRRQLATVLRGRPEGFTDGDRLVAGRTVDALVPGYDPDRMFAFS